jgi:hypothetical protein
MLKDDYFSIGFGHPDYPAKRSNPDKPGSKGFTWATWNKARGEIDDVHIVLSIIWYQSLLRNDLSISERMAEEWFCAQVLIHELMVSQISFPSPLLQDHNRIYSMPYTKAPGAILRQLV